MAIKKTKFKQTEIGKIPEDWKTGRIEDISLYVNRGISPKYKSDGIAVINQKCVRNGQLTRVDIKFHAREQRFPAEKKVLPQDILINSTGVGTLGRVAVVPLNMSGDFVADSHLTIVRIDSKRASPRFVSYLLQAKQSALENLGQGTSGQQELPREAIKGFQLPLPSLPEQRAIAKVLSDLDDKIELNQQTNKTLEAIGQAIFKHWFVDFEFPNEQGKPYKSSGGKMVDSELGKIPKNWGVGKLGGFIKFIKGKKPDMTSVLQEESYLPHILIETLDGQRPLFANPKNMTLTIETDVIVVMDGASSGRTERGFKGILGSTLAKIEVKELDDSFVYGFLKINEEDIRQNTTGTSIPHADKKRIEMYLFAVPNKDLLIKFKEIMDNALFKQTSIKNEIFNLSQIRDSLLPKLMSGKIRVLYG